MVGVMQVIKSRKIISILFSFSLLVSLLSGCGGADTPFTLVNSNPGNSSGNNGNNNNGNNGNTEGQGGCRINFTSELLLKAKAEPGSTGADAQGIIASDPHGIPPIPLHFNFSGDTATVTMRADEFPDASITLSGFPVGIKQKQGTQATGTFNPADGSLTINNIAFTITGLGSPFELTGFNLTTGHLNQTGSHGNIEADGSPLAADKSIKLVGGVQIPPGVLAGFSFLDNAALIVAFDGSLDQTPSAANCSGSGSSGSSLAFKEVVTGEGGAPAEVDLASNNTLNFGGVFVPQAGTDNPGPADTKFFKTKTLRVKNNTSSAVTGTITNPSGYTVTPTAINITAGTSQDFQIKFGFSPVSDYSETNVPSTRTVNGSITIGSGTVNLAGIAKRAGPELTILRPSTETGDPTSVNLGITPVFTTGTGASSRLMCPPPNGIPILARKITIQNTGVRPLNVTKINAPVDNDTDSSADPGCLSYGNEFQRMSLSVEGGASCQTQTILGHTYLTDNCTIPVGDGKINFKVVYLPKNASSVANNGAQDTAQLAILSNDPLFITTPLTLSLQAGVSKDTSDLLAIRKQGSQFLIRNGGSTTLNISDSGATKLDQPLELVNSSSDRLQNVQITLSGTDADKFQVCNASFSNCAASNPGVVTEVSAMAGTNPGISAFGIRFTKPGSGSGPFPVTLNVAYVPESTKTASNPAGVSNQFRVTLSGTVGLNPLNGKVKMEVDFIASYINSAALQNTATDSLDFRNLSPAEAFLKSGALIMTLSVPEGEDPSTPLRDVSINMPFPDNTTNPITFLNSASKEARRRMIRVFTSKMSSCPTGNGVCSETHPNCSEPDSISGSYIDNQCSFFYYLISNNGAPGKFNTETGEMILPTLNIRLLNPFHHSFLSYFDSIKTDTPLEGSLSTLVYKVKNLRVEDFGDTAITVPLVPSAAINSLAIPGSVINGLPIQCPDNWNPDDPSQTPTFPCYLAPRASPTSDGYIQGRSARWIPASGGNPASQSITLSMVTRFSTNDQDPDAPPFMAGGTMWVAIQGRMRACVGTECDF